MAAELNGAYWVMMHAAWHSDTYGPSVQTFFHLVRAKHMIAAATSNAARSASIANGAHGMMKEYHLERMVRDVATAPIMPPNIDACADQIGLLTMGLNPAEACPPLQVSEPLFTPEVREEVR